MQCYIKKPLGRLLYKPHFYIILDSLTPSPIRRQLSPILSLLKTDAVRLLTHKTGQYKGEQVQVDNLRRMLVLAYNEYCSEMKGANCHLGCEEKILIKHNGTHNILVVTDLYHNGRSVYCGDNMFCLFYDTGN